MEVAVAVAVKRFVATFLFVLALVGGLGSCAVQGSVETSLSSIGIGEVDESASVAVLRFEDVEGLGSAVVYRRVQSLEKLVTAQDQGVLLCVYAPQHESAALVVPYLEQLSERRKNQFPIVLAKQGASDPFLSLLKLEGYPSFFWLKGGRIQARLLGMGEAEQVTIEKWLN